MAEDVGFQRGGAPAQQAQGGFGAWVHEKPWHFWVTVIIGLIGVYLAYKAFQNYQANNAGSSSSGSVLGSAGALDPGTAPSSGTSGSSTPTTAAPFWSTLLQANPLMPTNDPHYFDVGEAAAPQLTTLQQIANAFHLRGGVQDLIQNPNNADLKGYGANQTLPQGAQVWVTTSTIDPNAPNHLG